MLSRLSPLQLAIMKIAVTRDIPLDNAIQYKVTTFASLIERGYLRFVYRLPYTRDKVFRTTIEGKQAIGLYQHCPRERYTVKDKSERRADRVRTRYRRNRVVQFPRRAA